MIKNRSFESKFSKNLIAKHKNPIKPKAITHVNMMASGGVNELIGINKKLFEKFFGISIPKIKIHRTAESIEKASHYHAHSYAQGNNIYLGKDAKPIDTVEGQTVIAHEITHILQQKYLDMSSEKEMVDPSVLLEQKAQVVENRVRDIGGIAKSSGDYFRKWDVLPGRSYLARTANINRFSQNKIVQRWGWLDKVKAKASATANWVGNTTSNTLSTVGSGISSATSKVKSVATNVGAVTLNSVGLTKYAKVANKMSQKYQKNAIKDWSHAKKSGNALKLNVLTAGKNIASGTKKAWKGTTKFVSKHKNTLIEGGLLALNAASAVGKTAVGIGLMGTGIGSVAGAALIAGAALDVNDAWKNAQAMKMYATTNAKDRIGDKWKDGVPTTNGIATSLGFKNFDKNIIDSKGVKAFQFATNFISPTALGKSSGKFLAKIGKGIKNPKSILKGLGTLGKKGLKGINNIPSMLKSSKFLKHLRNKEFVKLGKYAGKGLKNFGKKFIPSKLLPELGDLGSKYLSKSGKFLMKGAKNIGKGFTKGVKGVKSIYKGIKSSEFLKHIKNKKFLKYAKNISKKAGKSLLKGIRNTPKILQNLAKRTGKGIAKGAKKLGSKIKDGFEFGVKKYNDVAKSDFVKHIKNKNYLKAGANLARKGMNGIGNAFQHLAGKVGQIDFGASMLGLSNVGSQLMHGVWGKENKSVLPDKLNKDSSIKNLILYSYGDLETKDGKEINNKLFGKEALRLDLHNQKKKKGSTIHPSMQRLIDKGEENDPIFSIDEGIGLQGVLFRNSEKKSAKLYNTSYKVIFRGTDSLQDGLVEDGGKRGTRQAKRAKDIYKGFFTKESSLIDKHNETNNKKIGYQDLIFGGHSLGGYVANSVMIDYLGSPSSYGTLKPTNIKAETYNALGVTTDELVTYNENTIKNKDEKFTRWSKDKSVKVSSTNFRMAFDPVSKIGVQPGITKDMKLKHSTLGDKASVLKGSAHSMTNFYRDIEFDKEYVDKPGIVDKYVTDNPVTRNIFEKGYNFFKGKPSTPKDHTSQNYQEVKKNLMKTAEQIVVPPLSKIVPQDITATKISDFSLPQEKKSSVYSFPKTYVDPSLLSSPQSFISPATEGIKHAKEGRHESSNLQRNNESINLVKNENTNENIDELSLKIFRNLKSEIMLEYSRKG